MKKKYLISESQLKKLVETNFVNQEIIDRILDKVSEKGENSLTELEKFILKNPDKPITSEIEPGEGCIEDVIKLLFLNGFVDSPDMRVFEDYVEVSKFLDAPVLKFFDGKNFIRFYCIWDGGRKVYMDFEGSQKGRQEVLSHVKNVWEPSLPNTEFLTDDGMSELESQY